MVRIGIRISSDTKAQAFGWLGQAASYLHCDPGGTECSTLALLRVLLARKVATNTLQRRPFAEQRPSCEGSSCAAYDIGSALMDSLPFLDLPSKEDHKANESRPCRRMTQLARSQGVVDGTDLIRQSSPFSPVSHEKVLPAVTFKHR